MTHFNSAREAEELLGSDPFEGIEDLRSCNAKQIGRIGERYAAVHLMRRGHELVELNWSCKYGEADIISRICYEDEGETIEEYVLTEVKTRLSLDGKRFDIPELAVNEAKRDKYRRLALAYLLDSSNIHSIRFDVIAINILGLHDISLRHLIGAYAWDEQ